MRIPKGQNPFRNLLSAQEAADHLGIRFQSVIEAIVNDRLPAYRWGKSYALKRRDVEAFTVGGVRAHTRKTRAVPAEEARDAPERWEQEETLHFYDGTRWVDTGVKRSELRDAKEEGNGND